jgi:hypothetical protein
MDDAAVADIKLRALVRQELNDRHGAAAINGAVQGGVAVVVRVIHIAAAGFVLQSDDFERFFVRSVRPPRWYIFKSTL